MRIGQPHIFDDCDAAVDDIATGIAQILASVDDSERKQVAMLEQQDARHWETPVQFAGDGREIGP